MTTTIGFSSICTATQTSCVGSKIKDLSRFMPVLEQAIENFDFPANGQALIPLDEAKDFVSCGVARRHEVPLEGYHIREWRGEPTLFVDRKFAVPTEHLQVVVYTLDAYSADPDADPDEIERTKDYDYIVVAVLASAGPNPPLSPYRFVHNLSGQNNNYKPENGYTIGKAVEEAKAIIAYNKQWATVADREWAVAQDVEANQDLQHEHGDNGGDSSE